MTPQALTDKIAAISPTELHSAYSASKKQGTVTPLNLSISPLTVGVQGVLWDGRYAPANNPRSVEVLVRTFLEEATVPRYLSETTSGVTVNIKRLGPPYFVLN